MAIFENNLLHFQEDGLSSVSFKDLKSPDIDLLSRPIANEDKLVNKFYPIYYKKKVSFQCLQPIDILVDGERLWCNDKTLQFLDFPKTISIGGKTILSIAVPQHFSM